MNLNIDVPVYCDCGRELKEKATVTIKIPSQAKECACHINEDRGIDDKIIAIADELRTAGVEATTDYARKFQSQCVTEKEKNAWQVVGQTMISKPTRLNDTVIFLLELEVQYIGQNGYEHPQSLTVSFRMDIASLFHSGAVDIYAEKVHEAHLHFFGKIMGYLSNMWVYAVEEG